MKQVICDVCMGVCPKKHYRTEVMWTPEFIKKFEAIFADCCSEDCVKRSILQAAKKIEDEGNKLMSTAIYVEEGY